MKHPALRIAVLAVLPSMSLVADSPASEILIFRSKELVKLSTRYASIVNIPDKELKSITLFRFYTQDWGTSFVNFQTPRETYSLRLAPEFPVPTMPAKYDFEFSYSPRSGESNSIRVRAKLIQIDPAGEPFLPPPTSGKAPKQFHWIEQPFHISEGWQTSEYTIVRFTFNLKK